jgi:hypothetical protein
MSSIDVKKSFTTPLLKELNSNKETREQVETQQGQLLILSNANAFKTVIEGSLGIEIPDQLLRRALRAGRKRALQLQNKFSANKKGKRRLATIKRRLKNDGILSAQNLKVGQNLFVVGSFESSLRSIKDIMLEVLYKALDIEDEATRADISSKIQKGHGEEGYAVSQVQIAKTMGRAAQQEGGTALLKDNFNTFLKSAKINEETRQQYLNQVESLSVQYKNMVTKSGKLRAQYFSIITFQDQDSNTEDGKMEKQLVTLFRRFLNKTYGNALIDMKGSSTIRQKVASHVVHSLTDEIGKSVRAKIKLDPTLPKKGSKSSGKTISKAKKAKKTSLTVASTGTLKRVRRSKAKKGFTSNPLALIVALNKELPETVRKNMQLPALENRTGRFADSVRVTDIMKTAKGFPSIGYTYQRDPYEVFEMGSGNSRASLERDPRQLIDRSIREIAAEFAIGRFYTRRV